MRTDLRISCAGTHFAKTARELSANIDRQKA
jgi:hypothetical protein